MTIRGDQTLPAWTFTIGLWHTFGHPEVAIFGLDLGDMGFWLNEIGGMVRSGRTVADGDKVDGILPTAPLEMRAIHRTWHPDLFGYLLSFSQRPPIEVLQAVWPDRTGLFPWDGGVGDRCLHDQPRGWLEKADREAGSWPIRLGPWSFEDPPDTLVFTTTRILSQERKVTLVFHDHNGDWQFLDGDTVEVDDVARVHFRHIVDLFPNVAQLADLPSGWEAEQQGAGDQWVPKEVTPE